MKDGDFSLFRNKEKKEKQPDMTGKCMIDGVVYKISAWAKGEGESRFLSGKIQVMGEGRPKTEPEPTNQYQDDLPF